MATEVEAVDNSKKNSEMVIRSRPLVNAMNAVLEAGSRSRAENKHLPRRIRIMLASGIVQEAKTVTVPDYITHT